MVDLTCGHVSTCQYPHQDASNSDSTEWRLWRLIHIRTLSKHEAWARSNETNHSFSVFFKNSSFKYYLFRLLMKHHIPRGQHTMAMLVGFEGCGILLENIRGAWNKILCEIVLSGSSIYRWWAEGAKMTTCLIPLKHDCPAANQYQNYIQLSSMICCIVQNDLFTGSSPISSLVYSWCCSL